jgi:malate dehydrogenase (oxaloacetate-decarboxylating)(NADP+)
MPDVANPAPSGAGLLHNPHFNKGTAFPLADRRALRIEGLLPPVPDTLETQVARVHVQLAALDTDLQKYLFLTDLQSRNEVLFYTVLMADPATFMPLVYTPTVGEACQKFDHIFRASRGMYLPITAKGRLREILSNWPRPDVRFIVVTDGERILGLGDLGVGGMGIPVGKLALYTACAGVPPRMTLPITLDVGTNNHALLEDPLYLGLRQNRIRGAEYDAFIEEFVQAVQALFPKCCIQWEDFANINAVPILARYRDSICTYNDDIQGTAAVALAGILAALRITGQKLTEQQVLFLGGGSAATGVAELISEAMALEGLPIDDARGRNWLFDVNGLMVSSRVDVADFQKPFAHQHAPVSSFVAAVEAIKPTAIIGVSTVPKLFNQVVIEAMARINEPDHFSLLQPDLAFRMHGRGGIQVVGRPRGVRQRKPVFAGADRRQDAGSRPGQQRLHLPRHWHGRSGYGIQTGHRGDVHRRRPCRCRTGQRGQSRHRADLSADQQHLQRLAVHRRAGCGVYLRS